VAELAAGSRTPATLPRPHRRCGAVPDRGPDVRLSSTVVLARLSALAAVLRFTGVSRHSVFFDEAYVAWLAAHPYRDLLPLLRNVEYHPPLYSILDEGTGRRGRLRRGCPAHPVGCVRTPLCRADIRSRLRESLGAEEQPVDGGHGTGGDAAATGDAAGKLQVRGHLFWSLPVLLRRLIEFPLIAPIESRLIASRSRVTWVTYCFRMVRRLMAYSWRGSWKLGDPSESTDRLMVHRMWFLPHPPVPASGGLFLSGKHELRAACFLLQ